MKKDNVGNTKAKFKRLYQINKNSPPIEILQYYEDTEKFNPFDFYDFKCHCAEECNGACGGK